MAGRSQHRLYYDADDYRLLEIVNKILTRGKNPRLLRKLFEPGLHPRGIKEMAAPRALRIASAMIDLLGTLQSGTPEERIAALRAVHAESLHDAGQALRFNSARVCMQIMKEIVRAHGDEAEQLALAHDFREASSGKPRLIRRQLAKFHLLEMPEAWNQLAFDHHVHDANTKGRKSPTHLIMDAWIKGLRLLGVIYYNEVDPKVAAELLEAASVMGIDVRIGVEVRARLEDKYARLIWSPHGFFGRDDFMRFLEDPAVVAFFAQGREAVEYERARVLELLHSFNENHLATVNKRFSVEVPPLEEAAFLKSVGSGTASLVHLAEHAHQKILPHLVARTRALTEAYKNDSEVERAKIRAEVDAMNRFDSETIVDEYLRADVNPSVRSRDKPPDGADAPALLLLDPAAMVDTLSRLPCRARITLNPSNLSPADVLQVIYATRGRVAYLEIFNLKDWAQGRTHHRRLINEIRLVINSGNVVEAKRMVREILVDVEQEAPESQAVDTLRTILRDLETLLSFYRVSRLHSRLGSDSIGHSKHTRGMGLVVAPSLPWRARREIRRDPNRMVPVMTVALRHVVTVCNERSWWKFWSAHHPTPPQTRREPVGELGKMRGGRVETWSVAHNSTTLAAKGNIASLGGTAEQPGNGLSLVERASLRDAQRPSWRHLNSNTMNVAKILLGFLPAFLTFYLTKDWWLLTTFGAVIWFGITGLRNILQSVVGGGGLRRSSLLKWKELVSWNRVADSLFFTGFSVPLLDFLVKDLLLARGLDINTTTSPFLLYSAIALANGIYISSHNTFRGLPSGAIVGNFFRTLLSIPVALGLNAIVLTLLLSGGVEQAAALAGLQLWAAIISKTASDSVAALIEGSADRQHNLASRRIDYEEKLARVCDVYARLETTFPERDVLAHLDFDELKAKNPGLLRDIVIDALDLLYFWGFQPRARIALKQQLALMSQDERRFVLQSQKVLERKRDVSELLLDGLVGKHFEGALAFYLSNSERYLEHLA
ncbi:MAG: hypothetical protein CO108_06800, partial [Deltaproteobacteria bacterium CG_4_9_14_3_um_filter_63_12]